MNGKHQVVQEVVYGKYSVADIYDHFTNCQDYLTFDSDEARAFRRRKAFQSSAKFLMERAEGGVKWANSWSPGYKLHKDDPEDVKRVVENMRELGCEVAKDLTKELKNRAEGTRNQRAAAVKLAAALDASHKSIVMVSSRKNLL